MVLPVKVSFLTASKTWKFENDRSAKPRSNINAPSNRELKFGEENRRYHYCRKGEKNKRVHKTEFFCILLSKPRPRLQAREAKHEKYDYRGIAVSSRQGDNFGITASVVVVVGKYVVGSNGI